MIIVGAGMAGLLAANLLKHHNPVIYEAQSSLPNNHSAVLRFRSPEIGELLHIPFRKVKMIKASVPWRNPVTDALAYSRKTTGVSRSDRSIHSVDYNTHDRWIAPNDFIQRMARGLDIRYNYNIAFDQKEKVLSTIPMPSLLQILNYDREDLIFDYVSGFNIRAELINVDAYVSLYIPNPGFPFNRISITGNQLIIEFALPGKGFHIDVITEDKEFIEESIDTALKILGLETEPINVEVKSQQYQKILPIPEEERKRAIYWTSVVTGRAFQLGRYATWRPSLLMDDLVKDIRIIDRWINDGEAAPYEMEKHHVRSGSLQGR